MNCKILHFYFIYISFYYNYMNIRYLYNIKKVKIETTIFQENLEVNDSSPMSTHYGMKIRLNLSIYFLFKRNEPMIILIAQLIEMDCPYHGKKLKRSRDSISAALVSMYLIKRANKSMYKKKAPSRLLEKRPSQKPI